MFPQIHDFQQYTFPVDTNRVEKCSGACRIGKSAEIRETRLQLGEPANIDQVYIEKDRGERFDPSPEYDRRETMASEYSA